MAAGEVRVALLGTGAIAQVVHLPVLAQLPGVRLVGVCDADRAKAQAIASSAGVALGPVTDVTEGSGSQPESQAGNTARPPTPVEPGTQLVQATVTVAFAVG